MGTQRNDSRTASRDGRVILDAAVDETRARNADVAIDERMRYST